MIKFAIFEFYAKNAFGKTSLYWLLEFYDVWMPNCWTKSTSVFQENCFHFFLGFRSYPADFNFQTEFWWLHLFHGKFYNRNECNDLLILLLKFSLLWWDKFGIGILNCLLWNDRRRDWNYRNRISFDWRLIFYWNDFNESQQYNPSESTLQISYKLEEGSI